MDKKLPVLLGCVFLITALLNVAMLPQFKQCLLNEHFTNNSQILSQGTLQQCTGTIPLPAIVAIIIAVAALLFTNPLKTIAAAAKETRTALALLLTLTGGLLLGYFAPGRMLLYDGLVFQAASFSYYQILSEGQFPYFFFQWALGSMHPVYHGQLFFAMSGLANFFTHNIDTAFRLTSYLLHVLSGVTAFYFARCLLRNNQAALVAGIIYALVPEHTLKMLLFGRVIAAPVYLLLPIALLMIERYLDKRTSGTKLAAMLGLVSAAMFLSSPQDAQVVVALLFGYAAFRIMSTGFSLERAKKAAAILVPAGLLLVLLTSYWTVPYLLESQHVNTLQQKAVYEFAPKLPTLAEAALPFLPVVAASEFAKLNLSFTIQYLGLTAILLAVYGLISVKDRKLLMLGAYGAIALLLGMFINSRTAPFVILMMSVLAAAGIAKLCSSISMRKITPAALYGIVLLVVIADVGTWALLPPMPDFSKQQGVYEKAIPIGSSERVLDLHSNRRTYYPALVYIQRQAQVLFSVLTVGDPKAFYYAATVASRAAQEKYDYNEIALSPDVLRGLYIYNIGYVIIHPDQQGVPAAETIADKWSPLGFEKEAPYVVKTAATPIIIAPAIVKIPKIAAEEKGLFFTKEDFENRAFPWEKMNETLSIMNIDTATNSAEIIPMAEGENVPSLETQQQPLQLAVVGHAVSTNKVAITTLTNGNSYAQLSYAYYPWMKVMVDGKETPKYKSALNLLVIELPAGQHTIEIMPTLTPLRKITLALSLLALAATIALLIRRSPPT